MTLVMRFWEIDQTLDIEELLLERKALVNKYSRLLHTRLENRWQETRVVELLS